jgi:hypothetical protein
MLELGLVVLVLGTVIGGTALIALAPWWWLFGGGIGLIALGMLVGVPAGVFYHLVLWRVLRPRQTLGLAFWLHPLRFHATLTDSERRRIMPWMVLGAAGFVAAIVGCALTGVGAWRAT